MLKISYTLLSVFDTDLNISLAAIEEDKQMPHESAVYA